MLQYYLCLVFRFGRGALFSSCSFLFLVAVSVVDARQFPLTSLQTPLIIYTESLSVLDEVSNVRVLNYCN